MSTDAYRLHLIRARAALEAEMTGIIAQVPQALSARPTLDRALRAARADAVATLGRYPAVWISGFTETLQQLVDPSAQDGGAPVADLDALSIMDDLRVQEEIEVVQASQVLGDEAAGPLLRLRRLEAALQADLGMAAPSLIGPGPIGRALWRACERLPLSVAARSEAVRAAVRLLAPRLGQVYLALIEATRLEDGIEVTEPAPVGRASGGRAPGGRAEHATGPRAAPPPGFGGPRPSDPNAPVRAGRPVRGADAFDALGGGFDVTRPGALMVLLDSQAAGSIQGLADVPPTQPIPLEGDGAKIPRLIHRQRDSVDELGARGPGAGVHLLVGRIFDEIVSDPVLDREGANWIGRLQPAVLRLAQEDDTLLRSHRHPAWTLVNQLATLFSAQPGSRPPNLADWLERVTTVLRQDPRRERFETAHRMLMDWRTERMRRSLTDKAPAVELLREHARLASGVEAARKRLDRRLDAARADDAVRRFVNSVWSLVCARQEDRPAPVADGTPDAWDTATDLIWSTSTARSRLDAPTLSPMIGGLVERLRKGMASLSMEPAVQDAWLHRLAALHVTALQRAPEEAHTDLPLTIDLALEDELPEHPPQVEAGPVLDPSPRSAQEPGTAFDLGDTLALRIQGEWTPVTLVWRSDNGEFLLFDRPDGQSLSVTRRSLRRLLDEGLAVSPDAGSALARAARKIVADGAPLTGGPEDTEPA